MTRGPHSRRRPQSSDTTRALNRRLASLESRINAGGQSLWPVIAAPGPVRNVMGRPYNIAADGSTDDLAGIQAAIDDANAAGGGIVSLPARDIAVNGTIAPKEHVWLVGQSGYGDATSGEETRLVQLDNTASTIRQVASSGHREGMGFKNLTIVYQSSARTSGGGLVLEDTDGSGSFLGIHIENVTVRYHTIGIHLENMVASTVQKCRVLNCGTAYVIADDFGGVGSTTLRYSDCLAQNCDDYGFRVTAGTLASCSWQNCAADACDYGWHFGSTVLRNVSLINCYAEDRAAGPDLISAVFSTGSWQGFNIIGLTCYDATGHALDLAGSGSMAIIGGRIQATAASFYDLDATGCTGHIDIVGDFKVIMTGGGAGRINDPNDAVVYHDQRTLQSQRQDSGGTNTVVAAHTQYGTVSLAGNTGASAVTTTVTYPEAYSAIHGVVATLQGALLGGDPVNISVQSVGASSFVVRATTLDGANFATTDSEDIFWIAKGIRF